MHRTRFLILFRSPNSARGRITQSRVEVPGIVGLLQKRADAAPCYGDVTVLGPVYFFMLGRLHEALGFGVVVRVAAHADLDMVLMQQAGVITASVLYASIRMVNQPRGRVASGQRHL